MGTSRSRLLQQSQPQSAFEVNKAKKQKDANISRTLSIAAEDGDVEQVEILVGCNWDSQWQDSTTLMSPMHHAAGCGHLSCVQLLYKSGASLNVQDRWGWTPCHRAIIHNHDDVASWLIKAGCDTNIADETRRMPLHIAASYGRIEHIRSLVAAGAKVNAQDLRRRTPLYHAVVAGNVNTVQELIQYGCDMNLANHKQVSPLLLAVQKGHDKVVTLLLNAGVHCSNQVHSDDFPLTSAMLRACTTDRKKYEKYTKLAALLVSATGEAPPSTTFFLAYRYIEGNEDSYAMLRLILLLFVAGLCPDLMVLSSQPSHARALVQDWLHTYVQSVLPLRELCRRQIRHLMAQSTRNVLYAVHQLEGVPRLLRDLILLKDV